MEDLLGVSALAMEYLIIMLVFHYLGLAVPFLDRGRRLCCPGIYRVGCLGSENSGGVAKARYRFSHPRHSVLWN